MSWPTGGIHKLLHWASLLWIGRGEETGFWTRLDLARDYGQVERLCLLLPLLLSPHTSWSLLSSQQLLSIPTIVRVRSYNLLILKANSISYDTINSKVPGPEAWITRTHTKAVLSWLKDHLLLGRSYDQGGYLSRGWRNTEGPRILHETSPFQYQSQMGTSSALL